MQEKNIDTLIINKIESQSVYDKMVTAGKINEDELYLIEGEDDVNLVTGIKGNAETEYRTGNVNLTAENIGALPADTSIPTKTSELDNDSGYVTSTEMSTKADISSPAFTGIPTAPTAADNTETEQIATTKFVQTKFNNFVEELLVYFEQQTYTEDEITTLYNKV